MHKQRTCYSSKTCTVEDYKDALGKTAFQI